MVRIGSNRIIILTLVLVLAVLVWVLVRQNQSSQADDVDPPHIPQFWLLTAADPAGAIITRNGVTIGVTRDGSQAWVLRQQFTQSPAWQVCAGHCPDAVLSSSVATFGQPQVPDPGPHWFVQGQSAQTPSGVPGHGAGKVVVFGALSPQVLVAQRSDLGQLNQVVLLDPHGSLTLRVPPTVMVHAWVDPDVSHALVIIPDPASQDRSTASWFVRGQSGWQRVGSVTTDARSGCLSDDGKTGILLGTHATEVDTNSETLPNVQLAIHGVGNCAFSANGPVFISGTDSPGGQQTLVVQLDSHGRPLWTHGIGSGSTLSASTQSADVALSTTGHVREVTVLSGTGTVERVVPDVSGLIVDTFLVTVSAAGRVSWDAVD